MLPPDHSHVVRAFLPIVSFSYVQLKLIAPVSQGQSPPAEISLGFINTVPLKTTFFGKWIGDTTCIFFGKARNAYLGATGHPTQRPTINSAALVAILLPGQYLMTCSIA